jgi:hypothetical protein
VGCRKRTTPPTVRFLGRKVVPRSRSFLKYIIDSQFSE